MISEGRDFSLCLCTARGEIVCAGPQDLPAALGTLGFTVATVMKRYPTETVQPGDVFLVNDPHVAGSHMNDMRVVYPVHLEGALFAWLIAFGHRTDVGGPEPGSFNANATSCFAEGIRVPPIRIYAQGEPVESALDLLFANTRLPYENRGDLQAMLEACRAGERRLDDLCRKYGTPVVAEAGEEMMRYSERLLVDTARQIGDGEYSFTDWVELIFRIPRSPATASRCTCELPTAGSSSTTATQIRHRLGQAAVRFP